MTAVQTINHEGNAVASAAPLTPMDMLQQALASGASMEMMEKLLGLQERWEANQARKAFDEAMAAAKAEIPIIGKNRTVDFTSAKGRTNYRHEDLAEIARVVNPILGRHGLSYRFRTSTEPNGPVTVTCVVSHRLGYSEENTLSGGKDESGNKNSLQAVGSTLTYLQRMTLKASLGLAASDDDDGKASGQSAPEPVRITEEQAIELREMLEATNSDIPKFLSLGGYERLDEMLASDFPAAMRMLQQKARR